MFHNLNYYILLVKIFDSLILPKWRRHPESNRNKTALQTVALPLGYAASWSEKHRDQGFTSESHKQFKYIIIYLNNKYLIK
jgi:hypothetical protein